MSEIIKTLKQQISDKNGTVGKTSEGRPLSEEPATFSKKRPVEDVLRSTIF